MLLCFALPALCYIALRSLVLLYKAGRCVATRCFALPCVVLLALASFLFFFLNHMVYMWLTNL